MMRIFLYFGGQLIRSFAVVGLVLVALFSVFAFVAEADFVGEGSYTVGDAALVVALTTPALIIDIAPFIAMLGTVYGLSVIARNNEVVPLRGAGIAATRLVRVAIGAALILSAVLALIESGARPLHERANVFRMMRTAVDGNPLPGTGFWTASDGVHVNIGSLSEPARPRDIQIFAFTDGTLERYVHAAYAEVASPDRWRLRDVVTKRHADGAVVSDYRASLDWTPIWKPGSVLIELPLQSLSLGALWASLRDEPGRGDAANRGYEFYKRAMLPIANVGFAVFAASFVLVMRARGSHGGRVALGALAAILVYLLQQIGTNAAILAGVTPALVALVPGLVVGAAGFWMIRRLERV